VRVQCRLPVLQMALTQLAFLAGLTVCAGLDQAVPLLTDDATQIAIAKRVLWIQQPGQATPKGAKVSLDLSISAAQLHEAVNAVAHGQDWSSRTATDAQPASPIGTGGRDDDATGAGLARSRHCQPPGN